MVHCDTSALNYFAPKVISVSCHSGGQEEGAGKGRSLGAHSLLIRISTNSLLIPPSPTPLPEQPGTTESKSSELLSRSLPLAQCLGFLSLPSITLSPLLSGLRTCVVGPASVHPSGQGALGDTLIFPLCFREDVSEVDLWRGFLSRTHALYGGKGEVSGATPTFGSQTLASFCLLHEQALGHQGRADAPGQHSAATELSALGSQFLLYFTSDNLLFFPLGLTCILQYY